MLLLFLRFDIEKKVNWVVDVVQMFRAIEGGACYVSLYLYIKLNRMRMSLRKDYISHIFLVSLNIILKGINNNIQCARRSLCYYTRLFIEYN